jgi:ketosteroid isomerase-like protein
MAQEPRELYRRFLNLVAQDRWTELADLYAPDAVVEQPYARPGPARIVGREAVRERFATAKDLPIRLRPVNVVIHDTSDPEVVVAEFDYDVILAASGEQRLRTANIIVLRIRDGLIVWSRDFHDTGAIGAVLAGAAHT